MRSERLPRPGDPALGHLRLHELEAHQGADTTEWGSCEELLYPVKKRAGLTDPSDVRTTVYTMLLPGPAPAERQRRPWTSPVDFCDINRAFAGGR